MHTAAQRDFIWEQGGMDELADLELHSAFSIRTEAVLSPPDEVTSHVMANSLTPPHVIQKDGQLLWQQAITCAAPNTAPPIIPSALQPAIACSNI